MEPLAGVLYGLFRGTPNHERWVLACLEGAWPKLLGERLAAVCRPSGFENGALSVEILNNEWDSVVKSVRSELVEKLRAATAGEVKSIVFSRH
ncbi:MAG: DciA family protein [Acidobacteriota bacterium]|nr:DciA family protein [Acidobacteriota bacterium]